MVFLITHTQRYAMESVCTGCEIWQVITEHWPIGQVRVQRAFKMVDRLHCTIATWPLQAGHTCITAQVNEAHRIHVGGGLAQ